MGLDVLCYRSMLHVYIGDVSGEFRARDGECVIVLYVTDDQEISLLVFSKTNKSKCVI